VVVVVAAAAAAATPVSPRGGFSCSAFPQIVRTKNEKKKGKIRRFQGHAGAERRSLVWVDQCFNVCFNSVTLALLSYKAYY